MSGATTVICTLGMHRSGTSLVSRMLNLLGVHLGAQQAVSGTGDDNPKGFWEHHPLALLNDEVLATFGGRWDDPPPFPEAWSADPRLRDLSEKARRILMEEFAAQPLWGWKDPRTCLTAPFWQDLIGPMRYVLCVRNPRAVAASLVRRNGMMLPQADRLWLTYVGASLAHTSGRPRMFVSYEDLMTDWAPELRRLAAFIGRPERGEDPSVQASVADFIEQELCHHRMSPEDLAGDPEVSLATKSVYFAIRAHAGVHFDQASLDRLAAQAIVASDRAAALAAEHDRLTAEHDAQTAAVTALGAVRDDLVATVAAVGAERDRLAATTLAVGAERDHLVARTGVLADEAASLGAGLRASGQALDEIRGSSAWTFVLFLRRLVDRTLPVGTRRRGMFIAIVHRLAMGLRAHRPLRG